MHRIAISLLFVLLPFLALAQREVKVVAGYTYIAPETETLGQAKLTALDRAKIQAIADEFGTLVSQANSTLISNGNGESVVDFMSVGGSLVKGEWIETIGDPVYDVQYRDGMHIIHVTAKGRIREIVPIDYGLDIQTLCNGTTPQHARTNFKHGDDMYVSFLSPIDGYLSIYFVDYIANEAYCLLPYRSSDESAYRINSNRKYIFFSVKHDKSPGVDEFVMACNSGSERNDLYFIFSPEPFTKSKGQIDSASSLRTLSLPAFQKWLATLRSKSATAQIVSQPIVVNQ